MVLLKNIVFAILVLQLLADALADIGRFMERRDCGRRLGARCEWVLRAVENVE